MALFKTLFFLFCLALGLAFIAGGCYLGVWSWLVGGICQIIDAAKMTPVPRMEIFIGVLKVIFFEVPVLVGFAFGIGTIKAGAQ